MQFIDLQTQYKRLQTEIGQGIQNVLNGSRYIMGQEVNDLEMQLAEYVGVKYCITCANGTDALQLSLMAYNIKAGDAVFVPTFTFYASAEMISACGATPIFIDIDKDTFNIDPIDLEKAIIETIKADKLKPRAIIAVDLFGLPYDHKSISAIAEKYNLLVLEDGAQGFGGSIGSQKACSFGDIATTSFFPTKPLGCYGDGGAIFTNDEKVKTYVESLRTHGKGTDKYDNIRVGMNSRLDTIQAAILLAKLKAFKDYELDAWIHVAEMYNAHLKSIVKIPCIPEGYGSSYAQYSIIFLDEDTRDKVQVHLKEKQIPTMIYYKKPLHQQTVYRNNISIYRDLKNSELISKTILNLPMGPYLNEDQIINVSNVIKTSL